MNYAGVYDNLGLTSLLESNKDSKYDLVLISDATGQIDWLNKSKSSAQHLLSVITVIALAFIYFDLNEEKNLTGTFEKIDSIGQ